MVTPEINGLDPKFKKTEGGKALSVVQWIRGLATQRLEKRIVTYHEELEGLGVEAIMGIQDPYKMNRLQQLNYMKQLENQIHSLNNTLNEPTTSSESTGGPE